MTRAPGFAGQLGLPARIDHASDPFFGRGGKLMAVSQVEQQLKFELLVPVRSAEEPTACMSFNYHRDHFGTTWNLRTAAGETAHTGCVAFGIDRLALALFATHGLDLPRWPAAVRKALTLRSRPSAAHAKRRKSDAEQRVLGVGEVAKARAQRAAEIFRRGAAAECADSALGSDRSRRR